MKRWNWNWDSKIAALLFTLTFFSACLYGLAFLMKIPGLVQIGDLFFFPLCVLMFLILRRTNK